MVAGTALGGIAHLADFATGASIVFTYGFTSGLASILAAAVIIFLAGIPIARACAKYGLDMDLVTRGAGFGYFGPVGPDLLAVLLARLRVRWTSAARARRRARC